DLAGDRFARSPQRSEVVLKAAVHGLECRQRGARLLLPCLELLGKGVLLRRKPRVLVLQFDVESAELVRSALGVAALDQRPGTELAEDHHQSERRGADASKPAPERLPGALRFV